MSYTLRNLLIAAALGLIGIILTTSYINSQRAKLERGKQEVLVMVAKKDIPAGTQAKVLDEGGYLEESRILREDQPPQALHSIKEVKELSVNETVYQGEVLTAHKFETTSGLNPTEQIQGTERLMSIYLFPMGQVAQFVKPGDSVDIMASGTFQVAEVASIVPGLKRFAPSVQVSCTFLVGRDVTVLQTPESLLPKGTEVTPAAIKVKGDPEMYVIQAKDSVQQGILWSQTHSNNQFRLQFLLRPSEGAQETKLPPMCFPPNVT